MCTAYAQTDPTIIAQYHCDEGKDSILHDSGPHRNDIVLHNVSWSAGKYGSGLDFKGAGYGSVVEPSGTLNDFGAGDFSVALWINTLSASNNWYKENILSKGDPFNTGVTLSIEHGRTYACVGNSGLRGFSYDTKYVNDGVWHYYVCVKKDRTVSIYNDTTFIISYQSDSIVTVPSTLFLGTHGTKGDENYIGKLDEITLYARALSPSEIIANLTNNSKLPSLISIVSPAENRQPVFSWHPVSSGILYIVSIGANRQLSSIFLEATVTDTIFQPPLPLPFGIYYWMVSCADSTGRHSVVDSFQIAEFATDASKSQTLNAPSTPIQLLTTVDRNSVSIRLSRISRRVHATMLSVSGRIIYSKEFLNTDAVALPLREKSAHGIVIVRVVADGKVLSGAVVVRQ